MPKNFDHAAVAEAAKQLPEVCEVCGQKIDKRSPASVAHHMTPRHLPFTGKRQSPWRR